MTESLGIALVTGASKGIGYSLVKELISNGWRVVGVARSKEKLHEMERTLREHVFMPCECDVSDRQMVKTASKMLVEKNIVPTLFFLNAGIAGESACEDMTIFDADKHKEILDTNYYGVLHWVEEWLPICQKREGAKFVVTSSINAIFAPPTGSAYAASKAAIAKAFEGLSLTYYNTNLNFSVVYAGPVATDGLKGKMPFAWSPERMAKYMVKNANKEKSRIKNSLFYTWLARLLRVLPSKYTMRILGGHS